MIASHMLQIINILQFQNHYQNSCFLVQTIPIEIKEELSQTSIEGAKERMWVYETSEEQTTSWFNSSECKPQMTKFQTFHDGKKLQHWN